MQEPKLMFRIYRLNAGPDLVRERLVAKSFTKVPCLLETYELFLMVARGCIPKRAPFLQDLVEAVVPQPRSLCFPVPCDSLVVGRCGLGRVSVEFSRPLFAGMWSVTWALHSVSPGGTENEHGQRRIAAPGRNPG